MLNYILVGVGSAIGGGSRFWASGVIANRFGQSFLPLLDEMMGGGLVTLEKARVIDYRSGEDGKGDGTAAAVEPESR